MATAEARGIHRRREFEITPSLTLRMERGVDRREPEQCWPWKAALRNGYGAIKHEKVILSAHVVAFRIAKGEIPDGMLVTHSCDNRQCCNPDHLFAGTVTQNNVEMQERRKICMIRGEQIPWSILTESIVRSILALKVAEKLGERRIARRLGLKHSTVKNVVYRKTWKHVPCPTAEEALAIVATLTP